MNSKNRDKNIEDKLKDALLFDDISFLHYAKDEYDINHRFADEYNDTLLLYSLGDKKSSAFTYLIDNGADITLKNDDGENIFHTIAYSGDCNKLLKIIDICPESLKMINDQANTGMTPLMLAILFEKHALACCMIELNVDINLIDDLGSRALHFACRTGDYEIVKKLIEHKAEYWVKDNNGYYPISLAVNNNHSDIVRLLYAKMYG